MGFIGVSEACGVHTAREMPECLGHPAWAAWLVDRAQQGLPQAIRACYCKGLQAPNPCLGVLAMVVPCCGR